MSSCNGQWSLFWIMLTYCSLDSTKPAWFVDRKREPIANNLPNLFKEERAHFCVTKFFHSFYVLQWLKKCKNIVYASIWKRVAQHATIHWTTTNLEPCYITTYWYQLLQLKLLTGYHRKGLKHCLLRSCEYNVFEKQCK